MCCKVGLFPCAQVSPKRIGLSQGKGSVTNMATDSIALGGGVALSDQAAPGSVDLYSEVDEWTKEIAKTLADEKRKAKQREYYQARKEKAKAYYEARKVEKQEYQRQYREAHAEELKVKDKERQAKRKEEIKAYQKMYRETHREELKAKRKARAEEAKAAKITE